MSAPSTTISKMKGKSVVLGVTGGIAAYKAAELVSRLKKDGLDVHVILTQSACEFIMPPTFESLSSNPAVTDTFRRDAPWEIEHIALAKRADVFVVAPATANFLAKYAGGIADDMLTTTVLATTAPVLVAPAMNTNMYLHPATQANLETLGSRGVHMVGPGSGLLACGDVGSGRMAEPIEIRDAVLRLLGQGGPLAGRRLLITAGPTREPLDPVRFLTNRSSGRMGYAIAAEAVRRGAAVTLVTGPTNLPPPSGATVVPVETTAQMHDASLAAFESCDAAILSAAPADYRPAEVAPQKMKKRDGQPLSLALVETPDIAAALGARKTAGQRLVIFAAETENVIANATAKLARKGADLAVANDVTQPGAGFDVATNRVTFVTPDGAEALDTLPKTEVASTLLDRLAALLPAKG